ncbi:MAG TPA: AMP-binding protein [Candidatus Saccharimonadales bacterium]|nr:AMP-binding protein [Candidatus Saccharimonadales bacterium]
MRPHLATLVDDFRRHGTQRAVVVHSGNRRHISSYAELANLSERFAAELRRRGIAAGDRVILLGKNSAEWIGAFFGCVLRGVLVVPLDATGAVDFTQRVIAETKPRLLVGDQILLSRISTDVPRIAIEEFASALPSPPFDPMLREASLGLDTPLQILFTSGTTSEPKGIVHTHRNVLASLEPIERELQKYLRYERLFHPLRFLHTLPLSHVFGQFMGLWVPPLLAAEVHFENRLQAPRLMRLIHQHRISVLASVPRVLDLLKTHLEERHRNLPARVESARGQRIWHRFWNFRDVHREFGFKFWAFVCGGASLPPQVERFWNDLGFALIQGYGMTETAALITLNHPFHIAQGTIGKPLPGREVRIAGDGEVLVRGEMVATSRWQDGCIKTSYDPWLNTGDLAEQDTDGQLRFLGRKSEIIVTSAGLNIHPEDVEAALNRQPGVDASAVVPMETPLGTEAVSVLIFRGSPEQAQSAIDAANSSLAEYQRVRQWKLWPQLDFPRTATGKIRRQAVTQWIATQKEMTSSSAVEVDALSTLIATVIRTHPKQLDDSARFDRDVHLDSLARVQLQTELEERLGVSIADEEFERIETVGQLRAHLGFHGTENLEPSVRGPLTTKSPETQSLLHRPPRESEFIYPRWTWRPEVRVVRALFQEAIMRPLVRFFAAPSVSGRGPVVSSQEPVLLIANHVTAFDAALALYALPATMRRNVAIAMSGEMLEDWRHARNQDNWLLNILAPLAYWLVTALFNVFPLPKSAGFRRSFAHIGDAMDSGYHVLVFPEGRRSADGILQPFQAGIGLLAQESGARVVPIALKGLGDLKQRKRSWFRSHILEIRIGEPIVPQTQLAPEVLATSLHDTIGSLLQ